MALAAGRLGSALVLVATLAYEALMHFAFSRPGADAPGQALLLVPLAGLPHAAGYSLVLWLFGRTLLPGEEALITRVARRFHGSLSPSMEAYTRRLTAAWCVFFAAQLAVSGLLLAFASLDAWSLFVNVLNIPLLAAMFVGDYLYRMLRYRDYPQASIAQAVEAFARHIRVS
jgi:uncharacterized membrane protein